MTRSMELLWALVAKDFKVRYKNTALGFVWSLANPVIFATIFYFVFNHILRNPTPNYLVFLLSGMFPWQLTATTLAGSPGYFVGNAGLVKKVYFPRILLPLAGLSNNLVHYLLVLAVAVPVLALTGMAPSLAWLWSVPALLVVQLGITLGLALVFASLNVVFRDLEFLTGIFVQILFFLTPILYAETALPESTRGALRWNPMYYVIPQWRALVLQGAVDWASVGVAAAAAAAMLAIGYGAYRSVEGRFAEYL